MNATKKRILLVGRYYIIEPLGIIHLAGVAREAGWEVFVHLVHDSNFETLFKEIALFKPDLVGFSIWTGYHIQAFTASDCVRSLGLPVVIGGPHATYFTRECASHADYVVKGEGFRTFRKILQGELGPGIHFDPERVAEGFPFPYRAVVYDNYPELAQSSIKSIMASVGCPFTCSYCYAPVYNDMYGGFKLKVRTVDSVIEEACEIQKRWPARMIYFQDDVFGFDLGWLAEFARRWPLEVGIPWHCQIRIELTRDERRLDFFKQGGCSGITLAIESGNGFLREFVLRRHMSEDLIVEGVRRIKNRGLTLRTEQILAVPFSDVETDLHTLEFNCSLRPDMGWTSILAPYCGTAMGAIASSFGMYSGNNDELDESFFDRSVLRHIDGGRKVVESEVLRLRKNTGDNPLLKMFARRTKDGATVFVNGASGSVNPICDIKYLDDDANGIYCDQTVVLQRLFNWLCRIPDGHKLGARIVGLSVGKQTWKNIGYLADNHLAELGLGPKVRQWAGVLACRLELDSEDDLPSAVRDNVAYFAYFPNSQDLAKKVADKGLFDSVSFGESLDYLGGIARRHLFSTALYKTEKASVPLALE